MITLNVKRRTAPGSTPWALRREGSLPAVVYGAHQQSTPITLETREFQKVFREAGEAAIVTLAGLGQPVSALIHEVDFDPVTNHLRHVDFYAVTKGEKVEVEIPLSFIGVSAAVDAGANLVKVAHELEVKADPMNLPHAIEVDLSALASVDDRITAGDLKLPAGVELVGDPEEVIALAQEVVEEKAEAAPADIGSIEVEKKGKEEETKTEEAK
ncbi:50S ribosomal protein L25 [Patescibacteria group bacterium]|nr:50S ribosomal protein L25 [Patescibacteria group bacterium]